MKIARIALLASTAALAGANAPDPMHRTLRVETTFDDPSLSDGVEADLREDNLGANEDFWGSWDNQYAAQPCSDASYSASGSVEDIYTVGDLTADEESKIMQTAKSVVAAALPFDIDHAKSLLLPVGLVVASLLVIAVVAVIVGVRRQQLSEPTFGPVELISDLPDPVTASAACSDESGSPDDDDDDETDTGVTILADRYEEEKEEEEEEGDFIVA